MKITYNRNSMFAAIRFLRANNPTAAKMSELQIYAQIERDMIRCAKDKAARSIAIMGYYVVKDWDVTDDNVSFRILVDPGVCLEYQTVSVSVE